jgi:hypothetical protein
MASSPAAAFPAIDPNNPFTRDLLRSLAGTLRAQADETNAEYEERFAAATTAWASFHPRDPMEQMLAAQIVGAHYAGLDCLNRAMEADDPTQAERLRRSYAVTMRTMRDTMRLLDRQRMQPAEAAPPPPVIELVPPPRRRPAEVKPAQQAMHREKAPTAPMKDPAKMTDEELEAAKDNLRTQCAIALFDLKHPQHHEALELLPELLPDGMVVTGRSRDICLLPR